MILLIAATALGCSSSEIGGTYDVEIEIPGTATTLEGTLILATGLLDFSAFSDGGEGDLALWSVADTHDANSCFILEYPKRRREAPEIVRVFETQIRGGELVLPIEIYRTPTQIIDLKDLRFFAGTIGGIVVLFNREQPIEGRIHGVRRGEADTRQCQEKFESFRNDLKESASG